MKIRWHSTAAIEIENSTGRIIFDPFVPLHGADNKVDISEYDNFDAIFITHGHFDHISDIPKIYKRNPHIKVYCTATPYNSLKRDGVSEDNLILISYGESYEVNGFKVKTYHGRHSILPKVSSAILSRMLKSPYKNNLPYITKLHRKLPENEETVFFTVEADNKVASIMGSMNLRDDIIYPTESDILILPYNGWSDNFPPAVRVIERLKPKKVFLDHYDDAFPPLTSKLDLSPILNKYPGIVTPMTPGKAETV